MRLAAAILLLVLCAQCTAQEPPKKDLPLPGKVFVAQGRTAFLIPAQFESGPKPWVWYAPTLPGLPGKEERWMFEEFLQAGISIAGIDAGESYGSPAGNKVFDALHREMVSRGYSTKPVMLGRSRGGLMTLSWAAANPEKVGAFAGIYPVCNVASYPGVAKAAGAFELSADDLQTRLAELNPIDRLENLAKARVPLFAIHGDVDTVVPLEANSGLMKERYEKLGGAMQLIVPRGQGHNMWNGFFECAELVQFVKVHSGVGLMIDSPLNYQVVQRNSKGAGEIEIRGVLGAAAAKADAIEYKLAIGKKMRDWQRVEARIVDARFEAKLSAPSGGWHLIQVRALLQGKILAESNFRRVGIGEIFVVAGQSNSANHGVERQTLKSDLAVNFDGRVWRAANDPQPGASGEGGSFIPPLGDILVEKLGVPVAFVTCGVGATSVREWLPKGATFPHPPTLEGNVTKLAEGKWESKGDLFSRLTSRMKQLGPNGFRAVLWHQGESDANQADATRTLSRAQYRDHLESLIRSSREEIGWEAPWIVAQVSYHTPSDAGSTEIRAAQASLWRDGIAIEGPDSDAITGDLRENGGKGVHFSGAGLRELARRWGDKILPWMVKQIDQKK